MSGKKILNFSDCEFLSYWLPRFVLFLFFRFDNTNAPGKINPTYKKGPTQGENMIQVLLAAANNDKLALQRYWFRDVDMNNSDYDGRTPLHLAAAEGHMEVVVFLLSICKVNPEPMDR